VFADVALARRIERAEAGMSASMVAGICRRSEADALIEPIGQGYAIYGGAGSPFNKIIGAGLDGGAIDEAALDRAERFFDAHGAAMRAEVSVLANPDVFAAFSLRGYRFETVEHVLGLHLTPETAVSGAPQARAVVSLAEGETALRDWVDALVEGFAVPDVTESGVTGEAFPADVLRDIFANYDGVAGFHRYLAHADGQVAGGGGLFIGGGVGILCGAATLARFRRQGVQAALLGRRLADAAAAGCDLAVVTTAPGSKSQQNAQRQGFALLYARAVLVRAA
jgi:GNAT superfamily N-acetyltransferase